MGLWAKAKNADSNYSVLSWGQVIFQYGFPSAWVAVVTFFATYRDWIWNEYGMLGALSVGLVAALIASLTFAVAAFAYRTMWPTPPAHAGTTAEVKQSEPAPSAPAVPKEQKYTVYEKEQRLKAIDQIYSYLTSEITETSNELHGLEGNIYSLIRNNAADVYLHTFSERSEPVIRGYYAQVTKFEFLNDVYNAAMYHEWNPLDLVGTTQRLRDHMRSLKDKDIGDISKTTDKWESGKRQRSILGRG